MKLTPRKSITLQEDKKLFPILLSTIGLLIGGVFCGLNQVVPFLFFFNESNLSYNTLDLLLLFLFLILFLGNFLIYYLIIEGTCRLFYKKRENSFKLFKIFGIIFLPVDTYLVIHYFLKVSNSLNFAPIRILDIILLIVFQLWSLWLLTFNLTVNKQLKFENSLIIALLIHYGGFSFFLLLSI